MKLKTVLIPLISLFLFSVFYSCKKNEEEKKTIPQVLWVKPLEETEHQKGDTIAVSAYFTYTSNIESITISLTSTQSDLNLELYTIQVNDLTSKVDFTFIINQITSESQFQLNTKIVSDAGISNYKRPLNIKNDSSKPLLGLVKILKNEYGKFNIQKLEETLSPIGSPSTYNYEYESSISMNQNLYVSTIQRGGLIMINSVLESTVLLENTYNADPFIRSMAVYNKNIYVGISTPSNQLIGFNTKGTETVRANLQMDISEEILPIDDLIYSIERPTNGGSFIIANYFERTGGYVSSQNITRLKSDPHSFDFGNKKQVYFYHNVDGQVQIERFAQDENNISIINKIDGTCLNQKPLKVTSSEVVIPMKNQLHLFTKFHERNNIYDSNEEIKIVRLNATKDRIAILTTSSIVLLNYPSFQEISKTNSISNVIDIQFID